jgi:hypothetical protein
MKPATRDRRSRRHLVVLAVLAAILFGSSGCSVLAVSAPPASQASPSVTVVLPSSSNALPTREPGFTPGPSLPPSPIGRIQGQLFGMAGHLMWRSEAEAVAQLDMLDADRLGAVRFDVSWQNMEPSPGHYMFIDKLDYIVDSARARGLQVILVVIETPGWANNYKSPWAPPTDPGSYARFVGMLAARYVGQVLGWEIWNEADLPLFWWPQPDAQAYTRLLLAASAAIRRADPSAYVVAAGPTFGDMGFLERMYDAGARGSFDALAVHPYTLTHGPDDTSTPYYSFTTILDNAHSTLADHGDPDIPIWITELGWSLIGSTAVSVSQRDAYTTRAVQLIRQRPWIQVLTLYAIDRADNAKRGLSENGVRSSGWIAYVKAVHAP